MQTTTASKLPTLAIAGTALAVGVGLGATLSAHGYPCFENYAFLSDEVDCNVAYAIDKSSYRALREALGDEVARRVASGEITSASVFFRDLKRGPTFGVNEYDALFPATLLKLTLIITYFDIAEEYPELFVEKILDADAASSVDGATVRELLTRTAHETGDEAYAALRAHLRTLPEGEALLMKRAGELGLVVHPASGIEESVTVKGYSSMIHSLFFARFLAPESANEVLRILSESKRQGIAAAVPSEIAVAHRFGTPTRLLEGRIRMHDCGVVYFPENPYSLCVVALGYDEGQLLDTIEAISHMVYEEVDSRRAIE